MKKIVRRNLILILIQIILVIPYNYLYDYYSLRLNTFSYIAVILHAFLCGSSFMLMNLTNKGINTVLAAYYLIFTLFNIHYSIFSYGPTVFLFFLIFGALLTSILKKKHND